MTIAYTRESDLSPESFRDVLVASTLGARRPVDDLDRLAAMLRHADLVITARHDGRLVGVARAVTDFSYCCYLSELAVDASFQRQGIGRRLIAETHAGAGAGTTLVLVAAPAAAGYYPVIGMVPLEGCWGIRRTH